MVQVPSITHGNRQAAWRMLCPLQKMVMALAYSNLKTGLTPFLHHAKSFKCLILLYNKHFPFLLTWLGWTSSDINSSSKSTALPHWPAHPEPHLQPRKVDSCLPGQLCDKYTQIRTWEEEEEVGLLQEQTKGESHPHGARVSLQSPCSTKRMRWHNHSRQPKKHTLQQIFEQANRVPGVTQGSPSDQACQSSIFTCSLFSMCMW